MTGPEARIHIGGNVTGQVAIGDFVYQAQAPGGVLNQIVIPEPIRAKPRPIDVRPRRNPLMIERTETLAEIVQGIETGPVQIVAGDGWGKTSLVAQLAYRDDMEAYRDGIAVVSAWGLPVEDVEQAIFEAFFECTLPDTKLKATTGQLRTSFAEITAAIVVDDLDVPRQHVDRIIDACATCGFLSTASSQTMWSGGTVLDLAHMEPGQAIDLFEQRLGRVIGSAEREAVALFAAAVSGYPLAVVSAAAAVRRGAVMIDALSHLAGAADPVAAVHAKISETLTLAETRVLSVLAALDGSPLPPGAVKVASAVDEAVAVLEGLKRDGLLQVASPSYRLPTATAVLLDVPDARSATLTGVAQWSREETNVESVASAGAAIASVMRSAVHHGDFDAAIDLGRSADAGLALSGRWGLWGDVVDEVQTAASRSNEPWQTAWAIHQQGTRSLATGDLGTARELLEQAAGIRGRIGDSAGLEITEHNLALLKPPPAVVPRAQTPDTVPPAGHGLSGWVWVVIVAAIVATVAVIAFLSIDDNDDNGGDQEPPRVVTTEPVPGDLDTTTESIDFPEMLPGDEATAEVELVNTGSGPLDVEDVRIEGHASFRVDTDCGSLDSGQTCLVTVTFAPNNPGDAGAEIFIDHSGGNDRLVIPVFGVAIDPPDAFVKIDPVIVDFGLVSRADAESIIDSGVPNEWTEILEVENAGDLEVQILSIRLDPGRFHTTSDCNSLQPGEKCTIDVRFLADEPGPFSDTLFVEHTGDNQNFEIPVSGLVPEPPNLTIEIIESFDAEGQVQIGERFYWIVPVVAEITNSGQEIVEGGFDLRFEVRSRDDVTPWAPALSPPDSLAQFRIDDHLGIGETITQMYDLAFDAGAHKVGSEAIIRAQVDSCFSEEFMPWPPCRIVESNEDDNVSAEFGVPIVADEPNLTIEIIDSFETEGQELVGETRYWIVPVVVAITNSGEAVVANGFNVLFEVLGRDDVTPWQQATTPQGSLAQFRVDDLLGVGETIEITSILGFNTLGHDLGSEAIIRAHVDSCFDERSLLWPPCRIVESNEDDNLSAELGVPIVPGAVG